jgi:putative FmdB family regulatory protein
MPFYEYECTNCKFYVEALQKISDPPMRKCPSCKKQTLKRLVSAPVFRLKGGGWYETDFKSDQDEKRNLAGSEKDEPAAADSKKEDAAAPKSEPKAADAKPDKAQPEPKKAATRKATRKVTAKPSKKKAAAKKKRARR